MIAKRLFDILLSGFGLLVLLPVFAFVAVLIKVDSPGPVLFRQDRVGRFGRIFRIHKFRTMSHNIGVGGSSITVGRDSRVTTIGFVLRRYKIDELPQLIDVLSGSMSLVGPRPEVPEYVARYPDPDRDIVLSVRPGITDRASLEFSDESELLGGAADPERFYVEQILPVKLRYYREYVSSRTMRGDLEILVATFVKVFLGGRK
jgi:lipopolysaccharide/colanic/teichoic acid biosynthesis glycosyltransferase